MGLGTLLYGTAVYNGSVRLPGFIYDEDGEEEDEGVGGIQVRTPKTLAALDKSPLLSRQMARQRAEEVGVELTMTSERTFNEI